MTEQWLKKLSLAIFLTAITVGVGVKLLTANLDIVPVPSETNLPSQRNSPQPLIPIQNSMQLPTRPELLVSVSKLNWEKGGFGLAMVATLTIKNTNSYSVKDLGIDCEMPGNSGTAIQHINQTIYEIIPASSEKTFRAVNMGLLHSQASSAKCSIASVTK